MKALLSLFVLLLSASTLHAQVPGDGTVFDQGAAMEARSPRAPAELDQAAFLLGDWDVTLTTIAPDGSRRTVTCRAEVTYANRGYAYRERLVCTDFDGQGHALHRLGFFAYTPGLQAWRYGVADSHTESISAYHGHVAVDTLHLRTSVRRRGSGGVWHDRLAFIPNGDGFRVEEVRSVDDGQTWMPVQTRAYTPHTADDGLFDAAPAEVFGRPAPGLPAEARQFDFIVGTWEAYQEVAVPGGQWARFSSNATAVHALGGHAVLEYLWYDVDPSLPDAAISAIRLYNRAMRRWESLYMDNRGNAPLFFGGHQEGERIVLTLFEIDRTAPFSYFIFHDAEPDRYAWHAESSRDGGASFDTTWAITFTRKALTGGKE